jgi:hypothetical protein
VIRKVYEIDARPCPECGSPDKVVAFRMCFSVVDRIIDHLKLTLLAPISNGGEEGNIGP